MADILLKNCYCKTTPLPLSLKDHEKADIVVERNSILIKVKEYIDKELDPAKVIFYDRTNQDFVKTKSTEILQELEISKVDYQNAESVSSDNDYELHLQMPPDSSFLNNYFECGILAWEANIDIQSVFNHCKAVSYICAYLFKTEDECSHAINQAMKEAWENKSNNYDQMKLTVRAYASRQCSVQETCYHIMPELWLHKVFPADLFANTNLLENRPRVCATKREIKQLPDSSRDILMTNMLDWYKDGPSSKFGAGQY